MKTIAADTIISKLVSTFESIQGQLPGSMTLRRNAFESFSKQGLPSRKSESYKYTSTEKLFSAEINIAARPSKTGLTKGSLAHLDIPHLNVNTFVLVNGFFSKELSSCADLQKNIVVAGLAEAHIQHTQIVEKHFAKYADINENPFVALNTAFNADGVFISIPENTVVEKPFHIINVITEHEHNFFNPRNLFVIGKNASVKFIETTVAFEKSVDAVVNTVTEVVVSENARGEYYKLQNYSDGERHINTTQVYQHANSYFNTNTVTLNAAWVRNNLNIILDAPNCEAHLNGLFITKDGQHVDNHTLVDHRKPNGQSNQLYKGILNDKSTGVFNGKIFVRQDAQKTNAYQSSKNILLSDNATINTKPELEIYADDVKCSHGSSTGHLNPQALFYLRSRGISMDSARRLLLYAFGNDVLQTINNECLKQYLEAEISKKIGE